MGTITAATVLNNVVTSEVVSGVLAEVVGLLPIVIPVAISFLAIRKGISFVMGMLRGA